MNHHDRFRRIVALQAQLEALLDDCTDADCCPCPTCAALDDAATDMRLAVEMAARVCDVGLGECA